MNTEAPPAPFLVKLPNGDYVKPAKIPATEQEANALRAYVSDEALSNLAKIQNEEIADCEKRRAKYDEDRANIDAIKERMRKDRIALKKWEAVSKDYFARPLFPRTDAAREATWVEAHKARCEALTRGESLRTETCAECSARLKSASAK